MSFDTLFPDFCTFAQAQITSTDIDPVYPVLRNYFEEQRLSTEQCLWSLYLYVGSYHLGSAEWLWSLNPSPARLSESIRIHTGVERRGFRGNGLLALNVNAMLEKGRLQAWVEQSVERGWEGVRAVFESIPYNGTWASYKWADLLKNVMGYPIDAPDIGLSGGSHTSGSVAGLMRLTEFDYHRCATDLALQQSVLDRARHRGVQFGGFDQLETALCDFNSLAKGTYYVGHDIDAMMGQINPGSVLWSSRAAVIPAQYLGEVCGWSGVRKHLKPLYRDSGILAL